MLRTPLKKMMTATDPALLQFVLFLNLFTNHQSPHSKSTFTEIPEKYLPC